MRIILESPYAGDVEGNLTYARRAMHDSLMRGEHPIASHLLYTQPGDPRRFHTGGAQARDSSRICLARSR